MPVGHFFFAADTKAKLEDRVHEIKEVTLHTELSAFGVCVISRSKKVPLDSLEIEI